MPVPPREEQEVLGLDPLDVHPQCIQCLSDLVQTAARLAAPKDPGLQAQAESSGREILQQLLPTTLSSPQIANRILRNIQERTGNSDPYEAFKALEREHAQKVFERVKDGVGDFRSRIALAALGNSVDFFRDPETVFDRIPEQLQEGIHFYRDDVGAFERFLGSRPGMILYLTDNTGEIYFDKPLYDALRTFARRVVLVVKGGPALNDLTRRELALAGLEHAFQEVADTGIAGAGVDWEWVSPEFLGLLEEADAVLSKGMANFETLYPRDLPLPVFFLFKIKCEPVQDILQAPAGSFMAIWKEPQRSLIP